MTEKEKNDLLPAPLRRRWFPLWKLDGYILREFLIKYSILMLVFVILFMLNDVYRDVGDFLEAGASWQEIVLYLICRMPGNIRFILPISMLLGCMWMMAAFGKNLEVTAMRASGVSLMRCGGMIFVMGILVTGINVYFNEFLVPETTRRAEQIFDRGADKRRYARALLIYRSDNKHRRWLFQMFDSGNVYRNVTLKTFWDGAYIRKLIGVPGKPGYNEQLKVILGEKRYAAVAKLPPERQRAEVERLMLDRKLDLTIKEVIFDPETKQWIFKNGHFVSYDRNTESRFTASSGTLAMHDDIPFEQIELTRWEISETPRDILNSVKPKDDLSTPEIWEILQRHPNMQAQARAIYLSILFYRIAFPWASFIAVFLGIPLAAKNERTGSMMAIITAVGLILIYMICAQFCLMLGKAGVLNPVVAGLGPTVGFIFAGVFRLIKSRN